MIQLPLFLKAATTIALTVIGSSSINNISQTFLLQKRHTSNGGVTIFRANEMMENQKLKQSTPQNNLITLSQIKSMKRHDLICLYLSSDCYAPTKLDDISGEWEGKLLDNNGRIMTFISSFLTNYLFSRNREWKGKMFDSNSSSSRSKVNYECIGMNRFTSKSHPKDDKYERTNTELEHRFDSQLCPSRLDAQKSLVLTYQNYQSNLSLWKTMVDELRFVEVIDDEINDKYDMDKDSSISSAARKNVLLGMGCMAWSGSIWNASPFLLEKID